jgi:hypothetical protein
MEEQAMPRKGRPRLVSSKASGTKLFVDDLREVIKLAQVEGRGTISDIIRDLVHEALAYRRVRAMGRDANEDPFRRVYEQAITTGISPLESELKQIKETLGKLTLEGHHNGDSAKENPSRIYPLLTEIIGFTMAAEMKTHLLLQNFLLSRGLGEEAVKKLIAEHEAKSRKNTEQIVVGLMQSKA